jgi:hypothetical protein
MAAKEYQAVIDWLQKKGVTPFIGEFFFPEGYLNDYFFFNFFEFGQTVLERHDIDYDLRPARIYYNDVDTLNALARTEYGIGLIEVNMGAIHRLLRLYTPKEDLFDESDLLVYKQIALSRQVSPTVFMFQMLSLFLLYHETGHLIQQQEDAHGKEAYVEFMDEQPLSTEEVRVRHMREFDADWFAGQQLALHIKQCAEDVSGAGRPLDSEILKLVGSLAVAAIYMYFLYSSGERSELYFEEYSHPHPGVRLSYMINCLFQNLGGNVTQTIAEKEVLKGAIYISERMMMTPLTNVVRDFSLALYGRLGEVEDYIKQIIANTDNYPYLFHHILARKRF